MIPLVDVPLFRGLDPQTAHAVAAVFEERSIGAGQTVFRQGDPGDSLVVILDGLFELVQDDSGEDVHLADIQPGRVLGLVSLVDPGARTATLRALEDGVVAVLDQDTFRRMWDAHGDTAAKLHLQLALATVYELRNGHRKLIDLVAEPVSALAGPELGPARNIVLDRVYKAGRLI